MVKKSAFTLIELIFAIVIIAITVVSLPMMNQAVAKGIDENINQEAIFAASTVLNEIVTGQWDDNSIEPATPDSAARVIDFGSCENNISNPRYRLLTGHIRQPLHRKCLDSNLTGLSNSNIQAGVSSLSDSNIASTALLSDTTVDQKGYKESYKVAVNVATNVGGDANVKKITVSIADGDDDLVAQLHTYSYNVGEVDYYKKEY